FESLLDARLQCYPVALPVLSAGADTPSAAAVRGLCDGTRTLEEVLASHDDVAALAEVLDSMVWLDQAAAPVVAAESKCLILSATPESALLSMGGYLLKRRGAVEA